MKPKVLLVLTAILLTFASRAQCQEDYVIKPGQKFQIQVVGYPDESTAAEVNFDGTITLHRLGQISVSGKTLDEFKRLLEEKFSKLYKNPKVVVMPLEVVLPRTMLAVLGEVRMPGLYKVASAITVIDAIALAGGIEKEGLPNQVRVIKAGSGKARTQEVDINKFLSSGDAGNNPMVDAGDTVYVPKPDKPYKIYVLGEVNSPGEYPVAGPMRLSKVIALAGGTTKDAVIEEVSIMSGDENNPSSQPDINLRDFLKRGDITKMPMVQPEDTVFVPKRRVNVAM